MLLLVLCKCCVLVPYAVADSTYGSLNVCVWCFCLFVVCLWCTHQEAKAKYAEMRRLDAEALQVTRQLGCQQCMPDEPATDSSAAGLDEQLQQLDPAERALFEQLHVPSPWPAQQTHQQQGEEARAPWQLHSKQQVILKSKHLLAIVPQFLGSLLHSPYRHTRPSC